MICKEAIHSKTANNKRFRQCWLDAMIIFLCKNKWGGEQIKFFCRVLTNKIFDLRLTGHWQHSFASRHQFTDARFSEHHLSLSVCLSLSLSWTLNMRSKRNSFLQCLRENKMTRLSNKGTGSLVTGNTAICKLLETKCLLNKQQSWQTWTKHNKLALWNR